MKCSIQACFLAVLLYASLAGTTFAAQVDFESVPIGTRYGGDQGHVPGQVVLTQDGINMSVEQFILGPFTGFFRAEVGGLFDPQFPTTPLSIDNINVKFDFTNLGFPVTQVTLDYYEEGGGNNFAVNGGTIIQLAPMTGLPSDLGGGVMATVDADSITLIGHIQSLLIGGQEFAIDNIVAIPEPSVLILLLSGLPLVIRARRRRENSTS